MASANKLSHMSTLRRVCAFIALDYEPGMERYYASAPERIGDIVKFSE